MSSPPDAAAPPHAMTVEIDRLCACARRNPATLYGQLLRENIVDALSSSFPCFAGRTGAARLDDLAGAFLAGHPATRPQFYLIAAEFVQFAQARRDLAQHDVSLLEYEWVLLSAEIDPARIAPPGPADPDASVGLNPTARLLVLPFDVSRPDWLEALDTDGARHACAVYRTSRHAVVSRPLGRHDCLLIDRVTAAGRIAADTLVASAAPEIPNAEVRRWIATEADRGLLSLLPPE